MVLLFDIAYYLTDNDVAEKWTNYLAHCTAAVLIVQDGMFFGFFYFVPKLVEKITEELGRNYTNWVKIPVKVLMYIAAFYYIWDQGGFVGYF